jgi:integrase
MAKTEKTRYPGIYRRHRTSCGGGKDCGCPYQATVWSARDGKLIRKQFDHLGPARTWRDDASGAVRAGKLSAPKRTTVAEALDEYLAGMEAGTILDRSGKSYKPATCRSYKRAAERRLKPALGRMRVSDVRRRDVQDLVDTLRATGVSASTIHNTLDPLRAVYRRAVRRDEVAIDPTDNLELPAVRGRRDRTASPVEAEVLINALPTTEQALWAMAIYVGPRRGELQELRWRDLDLKEGIGEISRAWDDEGREVVDVKTQAGERLFPLIEPVRKRLVAHKLATGRDGDDLVFGFTAAQRFVPSTVRRRALTSWGWRQVPNPEKGARPRTVWVKAREDALEPISLHEGRHSAATTGSAAGLDDLALARIMGHSSVVITRDRYGHVRRDRVAEVKRQLDDYYASAVRR